MNRDTQVVARVGPVPASEFGLLAQLAFASRERAPQDTHAPRHLAFLPPDALDMDLSDPMQRDFGDYELLEKIGQGGMGVVYRASQHSLDREVALKLLAAGPWASSDFIERFRREAQSAARLEHPNIVTVFEAGSQHDLHYFSMRLVRGESLASRLQRGGPLAPRDAARLLRVIADALDYAHRLGVLHLDLKPGNVLIDESGEPMVADFGLARRIDQALAEEGDEVSGTPSYMAPEQAVARSQRIGRGTDIYGLGAILYETLSGRPPFLAATPHATLEQVVNGDLLPLRDHHRAIPADLEAICLKCLAKDPDQRYPTAAALSDDLRRYGEDRPVSVRQPGVIERWRRWIRREPRVAAAVGAFILALLIGLAVSAQQWRRAESSAETSRRVLWEGRRAAALRLQQDGKGYEALTQLIDNLREQEAAGANDLAALEQRRIGLLTAQGATLIDRIVIDDANPLAVELSPDGSTLAIALNDQSVRWYDSATLTERGRISLAQRLSSSGVPRAPMLLRFVDERRLRVTLAWFANYVNPTDGDTWMVDLEQGAVIEPPPAFVDFSEATWSADGQYVLLRNRHSQTQLWQASPWRALSPLVETSQDALPWLLDPRGRFAVRLETGMFALTFYSLPELTPGDVVAMPYRRARSGASAWALSDDGKVLALGDVEGRVFLLDVESRALRMLPTARGREVTWLEFSEDGTWFASGSYDGSVYAFEVASGDALAAGQMKHDFVVRRVGLNRDQRLLIASGEGQIALWRLSRRGQRALPAQRIGAGPAPHGLATQYAVGWSLATGLLASAGIDGQVRLWRLPTSPTLPARAARQHAEPLAFDGHRLVDVEWNRLRLIDASGTALSNWRSLAQPPGFAELLDGGRLLLTTIGPSLHLEDAVTLRPLATPLVLPDSPQRLLVSPDSRRVVLSFGGSGENGFEERLQMIDTRSGQRLPGSATLRGPMRNYAFSPDGRRLLAVGPAEGATTLLSGDDLSLLAEYPHDPYEPVQWADFASTSSDLLMVTQATDPRMGSDKLLVWDSLADEVRRETALGPVQPAGVLATDAGSFVSSGGAQDTMVDTQGTSRLLAERMAPRDTSTGLALSEDRGLIARGYRHSVQLYDAASGETLGPPLQADIAPLDAIAQLAFSPSGDYLLARSGYGHWLRWSIATATRSAAQWDAALAPLGRAQENQRLLFPPTTDERRALRQRDPGTWPRPETRPSPTTSRLTDLGEPIPARGPDTPAHLVDLDPVYNFSPEEIRNSIYNILSAMRPLPAGVQRITGVDFDLRGMVQTGSADASAGEPGVSRGLACLPLPSQTASAVHLLLRVSVPQPVATDSVLAAVRLHYADGSNALLPLRAGREVPGYADEDDAVPFAFATSFSLGALGIGDQPLVAPRLANPHPDRLLRCMDLDVPIVLSPVLLLGITLETPLAGTTSPSPVIASPGTGSSE